LAPSVASFTDPATAPENPAVWPILIWAQAEVPDRPASTAHSNSSFFIAILIKREWAILGLA
jgi:hypothetical protein